MLNPQLTDYCHLDHTGKAKLVMASVGTHDSEDS